jgi:hypothetical protein
MRGDLPRHMKVLWLIPVLGVALFFGAGPLGAATGEGGGCGSGDDSAEPGVSSSALTGTTIPTSNTLSGSFLISAPPNGRNFWPAENFRIRVKGGANCELKDETGRVLSRVDIPLGQRRATFSVPKASDFSTRNLRLRINSPARLNGMNAHSLISDPHPTDLLRAINGRLRPTTGAWDMGAFHR